MAYPAKNSIRSIAIALILLTFITTMIEIMLAGIDYKLSIIEWQPFVWRPLPIIQITTIVITCIICVFGYVTFNSSSQRFITAFTILLFLSIIFNLSVGLLACAATNYGWVQTYFGCNGKYEGVKEVYNSIDTYLQLVDQTLCSEWCPCYINNSTAYTSNSNISKIFNTWNVTKSNIAPISFQGCSNQAKEAAFEGAAHVESYLVRKGMFSVANFIAYMKSIEEEFQCSGWCNTQYNHWDNGDKMSMAKYMFSDINRGPPMYNGCAEKILAWIPPYLGAWGAVTLTMSGFQIGIFVLSLCQCYSKEIERNKYSAPLLDEEENLSVSVFTVSVE